MSMWYIYYKKYTYYYIIAPLSDFKSSKMKIEYKNYTSLVVLFSIEYLLP